MTACLVLPVLSFLLDFLTDNKEYDAYLSYTKVDLDSLGRFAVSVFTNLLFITDRQTDRFACVQTWSRVCFCNHVIYLLCFKDNGS